MTGKLLTGMERNSNSNNNSLEFSEIITLFGCSCIMAASIDHIILCLVLVQPRKRPDMTEKLLAGMERINSNNNLLAFSEIITLFGCSCIMAASIDLHQLFLKQLVTLTLHDRNL